MAAPYSYISFVSVMAVLVLSGRATRGAALCLAGHFDAQLQHILHAQMFSAQDPDISRALDDVRNTLDQRWPGYKLSLVGSLATGLSTVASDVDLAIQIPNFNASAGVYVLQETTKLFSKQPELYSRIRYRHNIYYVSTFFEFRHIPSKRIIELEFQTGDNNVQNSKMIKYYFGLDKRFKSLGIFLKYWFRIHDVIGHENGHMTGYGLYLLIIFYLQQKHMVPPAYELQVNARAHFIDGWNVGFNELPYSTTNTENLYQLMAGFFKYYSEFNFEEYIVSPFAGRPIPRNSFADVENFPMEYTLYENTLNRTMQLAINNKLDTEVSIQDVFLHNLSAADRISHERATKMKSLMKSVARMFDELPSDRILQAILVTGEPTQTEINHNHVPVDGVTERNCIEVTDPLAVNTRA